MICNFRLFWLIYLFYLARLEPFNIPMLTQYHSLHVVLILYIIFMKGANISGIEYKWMNCIFNIAGKMLLMWFCIIPGDHSCTHWNHEISLSSLLSPSLSSSCLLLQEVWLKQIVRALTAALLHKNSTALVSRACLSSLWNDALRFCSLHIG